MKIKPYAVSVQWGEGFHYFLEYFDDRGQAEKAADLHLSGLLRYRARKKRKGAKPRTLVWELKFTAQDE